MFQTDITPVAHYSPYCTGEREATDSFDKNSNCLKMWNIHSLAWSWTFLVWWGGRAPTPHTGKGESARLLRLCWVPQSLHSEGSKILPNFLCGFMSSLIKGRVPSLQCVSVVPEVPRKGKALIGVNLPLCWEGRKASVFTHPRNLLTAKGHFNTEHLREAVWSLNAASCAPVKDQEFWRNYWLVTADLLFFSRRKFNM